MGTFKKRQGGGFRVRQAGGRTDVGPGAMRGARGPMGPPSDGYLLDRAAMQPFGAALARRNVEPVRIVVIGDSVTEGAYAGAGNAYLTGLDTRVMRRSWPAQMQAAMRARMPSGAVGGDGYISALTANPFITEDTVRTGSVTENTSAGPGFGVRTLQVSNGATVTWPSVTTDRIRVWVSHTDLFPGTLTVKVDGSTVGTVSCANTGGETGLRSGYYADFAVARGAHVLSVESTSAAPTTSLLEGAQFFDGDGGTSPLLGRGIHVINAARSGGYAESFVTPGAITGHWRAVRAVRPHLTIIMLGINDWGYYGHGAARYETAMRGMVTQAIAAAQGQPTSVLLVKPYKPVMGAFTEPWESLMDRLDVIAADTPEVAVLDLQDFWPILESGGATNAGLMQENDTPIHPTDAGMTRIADVLTGALTQGVVGGASSLTVTGGGGGSSSWNTLADKPSEFAPADHSASKITTGTIAPARLGSGTANSSKWLRGDGSWQDAPAGDPIEMVKLSAYCSGDGTDEAAAFQAAVDVCLSTGASLLCDVRDPIHVSSGVTIGDARANSQQRVIFTAIGALRLKARTGASVARLLTIRGTVSTQACHMEIDANGTTSGVGIWATNFGRSKLGHVHTFGFKVSNFYIEPVGNNNLWSALSIRATAGGTKHVATATCSALSAGSGWASTDAEDAPYSTWTLDTALPAALQAETKSATAIIFADGRYMYVKRVVSATSIEVWNENRPTGTSESVTILGASLNWPYYGDSGEFYVGQIDVRDNPNAVAVAYGGYGGTIGVYCQQNNFGGFFITQRAHGISFPYFYTELSGVWLICRDSAQTQVFVGPGVNSTPTNFQAIDKSWMALAGRNSQALNWYISKSSGSPIVSPPALPLDRPELQPGTRNITPGNLTAFRRTSGAATLRINNNYPSAVGSVDLAGPASGSGTDVSITLLNTSLGHTIEGGSTFTAKVYAAARVDVWLESGQTDWKVRIWDGRSSTATSVASAPAFVGQMAVASGLGYIATGTASSSDWKQITN